MNDYRKNKVLLIILGIITIATIIVLAIYLKDSKFIESFILQ